MTMHDFELLEMVEQLNYLQKEGTYIGKRKLNELSLLLYQSNDYYVELFYARHRMDIIKLRCFKSTTTLDPYLSEILIEDLV
ncbi:MAG: hypothetical protein WKF70_04875 [Chitinophagaceae bacterium]